LHLYNNLLTEIGELLTYSQLYYTDLRNDFLEINDTSAAWNVITNLQARGVGVDYLPQNSLPAGLTNPVFIVLRSDAATLAAATTNLAALDAGDSSGLTFQPAAVGAFGTSTPVPPDAPSGTRVINIPPGTGQSGLFKVRFTLSAVSPAIQLSGSANADDAGRVFLNGHPLTPSLTSGDPGVLSESGNATFSTTNAAWFLAGTNEFVVSDFNQGGPSGAAFYAIVAYSPPLVTRLSARLSGGNIVLTWPIQPSGLTPQSASSLLAPVWHDVTQPVTQVGEENQVVIPLAAGPQFYRLSMAIGPP
jgi:hypothetical protein